MKSAIRNRIENTRPPETRSKPTTLYLADAATQTNPEGRPEGRQRSAMNAFQHGLSGHRMILQDHELESYRRLSTALYRDYSPANESERQLVQKIVDCHTRINRIFAIENNIMNVGIEQRMRPDAKHDAETEAMIAQARTWTAEANSFEKLGRYESRISRQLLQYTRELDRIQTLRKSKQLERNKPLIQNVPSFRQTARVGSTGPSVATSARPAPTPNPHEQDPLGRVA